MNILEEQRDIIGAFHDGSIIEIIKNNHDIHLVVECQYIAEVINPEQRLIYVDLKYCEDLYFKFWEDEEEIRDLSILNNLDMEINSAAIDDKYIKVSCILESGYQIPTRGGVLYFKTNVIDLFDEEHRKITVEELKQTLFKYWASLENCR